MSSPFGKWKQYLHKVCHQKCMDCSKISWQMAASTLDFKIHIGHTATDDMVPQINPDVEKFTPDFKQCGFCALSTFVPPDSGILISKWKAHFSFIWKEDVGPPSKFPFIYLLIPYRTVLMVFLGSRKARGSSVSKWLLMQWLQSQSTCKAPPYSSMFSAFKSS